MRFFGIRTYKKNNVTTGRIYYDVISKERQGAYLGKTVQVIPHITDEIISHVKSLGESENYDVVIIEVGGTVGDIESLPYIRSEEHTSELQSRGQLVCRLLLEKKKMSSLDGSDIKTESENESNQLSS